jgi:AraC family transcriptional regulator
MNEITSFPRIERVVDLRRRIHRVVDFIDENLDEQHSLDHLADIACISPFHFHRTYSRVVGHSPVDTVRRLRLLRATRAIHVEGVSVLRAAIEAGYGSSQAFARAFRREFQRCPTDSLDTVNPVDRPDRSFLDFSIMRRPSSQVEALVYQNVRVLADPHVSDSQVFAQATGADPHEVTALYFDGLFTPPSQQMRMVLGIYPGQRRFLPAGGEVLSIRIEDGWYARIRHRGRLLDLEPIWAAFVNTVLPSAGWTTRSGPILRHFWSVRSTTPPSLRVGFLYVPIQPLARG